MRARARARALRLARYEILGSTYLMTRQRYRNFADAINDRVSSRVFSQRGILLILRDCDNSENRVASVLQHFIIGFALPLSSSPPPPSLPTQFSSTSLEDREEDFSLVFVSSRRFLRGKKLKRSRSQEEESAPVKLQKDRSRTCVTMFSFAYAERKCIISYRMAEIYDDGPRPIIHAFVRFCRALF